MKKAFLAIIAIGIMAAAYFIGYTRGRSSGFEDGAVWADRLSGMSSAMRAIAILGELDRSKCPRVAESLNHDIDYAILSIINADKHLERISLPRTIILQRKGIDEAFKSTGADELTGYRHLAEYRRKSPSPSKDKDVLNAIKGFLDKY